jgi:hypothetical protein
VSPSKIPSHVPNSDPSRHDPFIGDLLDPVWNRDSSHMTRFSNQVDDRPRTSTPSKECWNVHFSDTFLMTASNLAESARNS